jgi:uncharacterized protein YcaQ
VRAAWTILDRSRPVGPRVRNEQRLHTLSITRARMVELFDFDYQLEMYKPKAKRRWGFSLFRSSTAIGWWASSTPPPTAKPGVLRVDAIYEDVAFSKTMTAAVRREVNDLAHWLELDLTLPA